MTDNPVKLFVYGTLKIGCPLHFYLSGATFIGEGFVQGFSMFHLGAFPCIVPVAEKDKIVYGEIYGVDNDAIAAIDRLEGVPHMYVRKLVPALRRDGGAVMSYTYIMYSPPKYGRIIENGKFEHEQTLT